MENLISCMLSSESEPEVQGLLAKNQTLITNKDMRQILEQKGYGEISKKNFFLKSFESLYLLHCQKLTLIQGKKSLGFNSFLQICLKYDADIMTKFLIYRDLRNRGYIIKDGFGFGSDFRVYERGHFGQKGAKYLVFGMNEGKQEKIGTLEKKIEQITKMGKEPIIAVIERRGEVIYYKISRINFIKNKASQDLENFEF